MNLDTYLRDLGGEIEQELSRLLPSASGPDRLLAEAMRYAVLGGGKRLRPALFCSALAALNRDYRLWMPYAAALEMIHCYSLIHDDLPAMDDDAWRRGRPACHVQYGEAMAILAGDALLTLAAEILSRPLPEVPAERQLAAASEIMATALHMVRGQAAEFAAPAAGVDQQWLERIYAGKTAALFRAAVLGAALLAGATPQRLQALSAYAEALGLAFQITDDILDYREPAAAAEKNAAARDYVALAGMAAAETAAAAAMAAAEAALEIFGPDAGLLRLYPRFILNRQS
jgi:geranylgeranyl diphosphate synthase, type II